MNEAFIRKLFKYLLYGIAAALVIYLLWLISNVIVVLVLSVLLALIFDPFVKLLEREGFSRTFSTVLILIGSGLLSYFFLSFFIPLLLYQMNQLMEKLHVYSLHDQLTILETDIYRYLPFFKTGELSRRIENFISMQIVSSFDRITNILSSLVSIIMVLVIVPFITFFLLKDSKKIMRGIVGVMPNSYFEMSYYIIKKISVQLGRFVRAWIFDASFVGITFGAGLYLVGIENALPLGVIAGLGHLIPYFGPVIGGIPAIIISIIQYGDMSRVPLILLLILIVYSVDNGIFQPFVFSKSVDMHPVFIILLIIAGGELFGIFGMLLAIPTATVIKTAAKEIYFAFKNYKIARM